MEIDVVLVCSNNNVAHQAHLFLIYVACLSV